MENNVGINKNMNTNDTNIKYNVKINNNGEYRNFYGWTVISMVENDLKFIENYISKHNTLSKYFSALPSSSYHMTVYNIWCNGKGLLNHQKKFIQKNFSVEKRKDIENESKLIKFFNPNGCINDLLYRLHFECQKNTFDRCTLTIKEILYSGGTLKIIFKESPVFDKINICRNVNTKVCENDDKMGEYHITLAYRYADVDQSTLNAINYEIYVLNIILADQTITIDKPSVMYFSDMKKFVPFEESLNLHLDK
jgi:hypothetical protein